MADLLHVRSRLTEHITQSLAICEPLGDVQSASSPPMAHGHRVAAHGLGMSRARRRQVTGVGDVQAPTGRSTPGSIMRILPWQRNAGGSKAGERV